MVSAKALMLLYRSRGVQRLREGLCSTEIVVDLANHVALQAADDFRFAPSLFNWPFHVGLRRLMSAHAHDDDPIQCGVRLSVSATVEPMPVGLAARRWNGAGAAQLGERGLRWDSRRGRCRSRVKRVVRSTSVPIAELPRPRSPSQWPGTARSAASAGTLADPDGGIHKGLASPTGSSPRLPSGAEAGRQLAAQGSTALNVQRLVDGLLTDAHRLIVREIQSQAPRDLLGAPSLGPSPLLTSAVPASLPQDDRAQNHAPLGAATVPDSRSPTWARKAALSASFAGLGRRAERSACHWAVVAL